MRFLKNFMMKKSKKLVTHNGSFHVDDLFATAVLSILNKEKIKIIRTRDPEIIATGDYVYDVGGVYDEALRHFDHHQKGGAGKRENGIPYSSLGLVWKAYGEKICGSKEAALEIEEKIVEPIDAKDNGVDISVPKYNGIISYSAEQIFHAYAPTWLEENNDIDKIFKNEVKKIVQLLEREIEIAKTDVLGKELIRKAYIASENKKVILLKKDFPRYLVQNVLPNFSEPIYFIYPSGHSEYWKVEAVRENLNTMKSRKLFPEAWRGLMHGSKKLYEMTGVEGFRFCHSSGFFLNTTTKEGAIKLAQIALES